VLHNSNYKYLQNYMTFFYEYMPHVEEVSGDNEVKELDGLKLDKGFQDDDTSFLP